MNYKFANYAVIGTTACFFSILGAQPPRHNNLSAPTYYIAIKGMLESADAVRLKGATNLPPGANIEVLVEELFGNVGSKGYSQPKCVTVPKSGLFAVEVQPKVGSEFRDGLFAVATLSFDNPCKQKSSVRKIIGETGQYLGNDNYDDSFKKTWEETPGMIGNPQFEQTTHWHFGLYTIGRIQ